MKKITTLKTLLVGLCAMGAMSAWADDITLTPTADTFFSWSNGDTSYGEATNLYSGIWQEYWTNATPGLKGTTSNIAVFKFDVSPYKGKITSATFNVTATNPNSNTNTRSIYLGYFDLTDWTETSTANNSGMVTRHASNLNIHPFGISQPISKGETKVVSFSNDNLLSYLNEDGDGIVSLIIYGVGQECYVISKEAETGKPQLVISYTNETLYTATFFETNNLEPTVTIYSDEERTTTVTNGTLTNGTTYYYTATLSGYDDFKSSFIVNGENPSVPITMVAKTLHTFTVNAVCNGTTIKTVYTDNNSYEGKIHAIALPKYMTTEGNLVTHKKNDNEFYTTFSASDENEIKEIAYTAYEGTAYFVEAENIINNVTYYTSGNCSNNGAVRGITSPKHLLTVPTDGKYDITYAVCNNNVNYDLICYLYKNETEIASKDDLKSVSVNYILTNGTVTNTGISLAKDDDLKIMFNSTNGIVDYILIERKGDVDPITVPITSAGYATYCSPYALDFSGVSGLTAYIALQSGTIVSFSPVDDVPANTGVLLKGTAGTYEIPVIASSSTDVSENVLVGVTTSQPVVAGSFVLMNESAGVGFYKAENEFTVGANTAYIQALPDGARNFIAIDEATAIKAIEKTEQNGEIYNLAGQRVKSAQKGLYIIGGKKVVIK